MTGIFRLPSELLYQIIDMAVSSPLIPAKGNRYRPHLQPLPDYKTVARDVSCFPSQNLIEDPNALNLLLTSRRMYSETKQYLSKAPTVFKLDVAIVDNHWVWPTWRSIPVRSKEGVIERVEIELILCCTEDERQLQTTLANVSIFPEVLYILSYFVAKSALGIYVTTLSVNVDTTRYGSGNEPISTDVVPLRTIDGLAHLTFDPLFPIDAENSRDYQARLQMCARCLGSGLEYGLGLSILRQYIGNMVFCLNGNENLRLL